jgi:hypothetical protein
MTQHLGLKRTIVLVFGVLLLAFTVPQSVEIGIFSGASARSVIIVAIFILGSITFLRSRKFLRGLIWFSLAIVAMVIAYPLTSGGF